MPDFFVELHLDTPRGPGGGLLSLKDGVEKLNRTVGQVYRIGGKKFLDQAADNLDTIPSSRRYRAWHAGRDSTDPASDSVSLARRIVSKRNMVIEERGDYASVRIFDFDWMDSVAPHWSAIEFGSDQNVINASNWLIAFRHPGSSDLHSPGGPHIGKIVKIGILGQSRQKKRKVAEAGPKRKIIRYAGGGGGGGGVQNPIRPGRYLERSYNATIRHKLENELRSRIRASLGHITP